MFIACILNFDYILFVFPKLYTSIFQLGTLKFAMLSVWTIDQYNP